MLYYLGTEHEVTSAMVIWTSLCSMTGLYLDSNPWGVHPEMVLDWVKLVRGASVHGRSSVADRGLPDLTQEKAPCRLKSFLSDTVDLFVSLFTNSLSKKIRKKRGSLQKSRVIREKPACKNSPVSVENLFLEQKSVTFGLKGGKRAPPSLCVRRLTSRAGEWSTMTFGL